MGFNSAFKGLMIQATAQVI